MPFMLTSTRWSLLPCLSLFLLGSLQLVDLRSGYTVGRKPQTVKRLQHRKQEVSTPSQLLVQSQHSLQEPSAVCLKFFVPTEYLQPFRSLPLAECWRTAGEQNLVLELFHLNLFIAGNAAGIPVVDAFDPGDGCLYLARDHVYDEALAALPSNLPPDYVRQYVWEIKGNSLHATEFKRRMVRLGLPIVNYGWGVEEPWFLELQEAMASLNSPDVVTAFLGMPQQFATNTFKAEKRLLVDEMYHMQPLSSKLQQQLDLSFNATMAVAQILHTRYRWEISSFVGRWAQQDKPVWQRLYPFVNVTDLSRETPGDPNGSGSRAQYLQLIKSHPFYFSHMWETYGMPYYEMLQHGIPIFCWAEFIPPLLFQHHKNAVVCSLLDDPELCALSIERFYTRRWSAGLFDEVRFTANGLYAAETFGSRLKQAFRRREQVVSPIPGHDTADYE